MMSTITLIRILLACVMAWWVLAEVSMAQENALKDHPVPYLALHGNDPVHWQEWGPEVMEMAQRDNRIVMLSIGYFSCHWCHVMQRESFQDAEIADFANRHFIFVKVDKEMNPMLDHAMISFAQVVLGRAGWPLNVFITPEGSPLHARLYLPPDEFLQVLVRLQALWSGNEAELRQLIDNFPWHEENHLSGPVDDLEIKRLLTTARQQILDQGDQFQGGFGFQNKFPSVPQLAFLLTVQKDMPDPQAREFLMTTLDAMVHLGLRDHLAGGFFRYTVDPGWEIPHFEKMLYNNATLASLYLDAGKILGHEDYLLVARETLDFLHRDMWKDGALVSSLSAVDDHSVEGGAYLWSTEQVQQILTEEEFAVADAVWAVSMPAELDAGNHLRQYRTVAEAAQFLEMKVSNVIGILAQCREKMLLARSQRIIPADDKLVSGWNGLALSAFARAAKQFPDSQYAETAAALQQFLTNRVTVFDGEGRLSLARAEVQGSPHGRGALEDYAYVARGLYDWATFTDKQADYVRAAEMAQAGWADNLVGAGWRNSPDLVQTIPAVVRLLEDGPTPSASAVMLQVSRELARVLGDRDWAETVQRVSRWGVDKVAQDPFWYATQLTLLMQNIAVRSN